MRFTDNPLEWLMKQKPEGGRRDEENRPKLPPACLKCPYRGALCDAGACWPYFPECLNKREDDSPVEA